MRSCSNHPTHTKSFQFLVSVLQSVGGCVEGSGGVVTSGVGEGEGKEDGTGVEGAAVRVCV